MSIRTLALLVLLLPMLLGCAGGAAAVPTPPPTEAPSGRLTFAGSTTMQPLVDDLAEHYRQLYPNVEIEVAAGGSVVGINAVHDGSADIGMVSRHLNPDEKRTDVAETQIAVDVLAIIVHRYNPVEGLSLEQLRDIYLGKITNWSEVGGADLPILPVIREVSSGTRGAFDEIVLAGAEPYGGADVQVTAGEVHARVASSPSAIGYVGFGNMGGRDVRVLQIDGYPPSPQNALNDRYRLQRPLLLLTGPLSRRLARSFVSFALSEEGQRIVAEDGWVPVGTSAGRAR